MKDFFGHLSASGGRKSQEEAVDDEKLRFQRKIHIAFSRVPLVVI